MQWGYCGYASNMDSLLFTISEREISVPSILLTQYLSTLFHRATAQCSFGNVSVISSVSFRIFSVLVDEVVFSSELIVELRLPDAAPYSKPASAVTDIPKVRSM